MRIATQDNCEKGRITLMDIYTECPFSSGESSCAHRFVYVPARVVVASVWSFLSLLLRNDQKHLNLRKLKENILLEFSDQENLQKAENTGVWGISAFSNVAKWNSDLISYFCILCCRWIWHNAVILAYFAMKRSIVNWDSLTGRAY